MFRLLCFVITYFLAIHLCISCPNLNISTQCYSKKKDDVPRLYGTKTTYSVTQSILDVDIHRSHKLLKDYKPIMVYGVFRHAIRYPDKEDIEQMLHYLPLFQKDILRNKGELCEADLEAFRNWKPNMEPDDDNNVSDSGREETILTAIQMKQSFKKNLDPEKADIEFGVTPKIRTTQTAEAFITGIRISKTIKKSVCEDDSSESDEVKFRSKLDSWNPLKKELDFLSFHRKCKEIMKSKGGKLKKPKVVDDFRKSELITQIATLITRRLGITTRTNLSDFDLIEVISRACKFEYAIERESPWCAAFGIPELKVLEYLEDLEDYHDDAHGREVNRRMPCPLMKDLIGKIKEIRYSRRLKTYLYFTHAGVLKRLWAYLGMFYDRSLLTDVTPEEGFCTRNNRKWKSSLNTPFGANIVFAVYESKRSKRSHDYRVVAYVNGKIEKIRNCSSEFCKLDQFIEQFQDVNRCDLQSICVPPYQALQKPVIAKFYNNFAKFIKQ